MSLKQQRILIVGGTSGFGLEVARLALQAGANVYVIGHTVAHVRAAVTKLTPLGPVTGSALDAQNGNELTAFFSERAPFDHVLSFLGGAMGGGFLITRWRRSERPWRRSFLPIYNLCNWLVDIYERTVR